MQAVAAEMNLSETAFVVPVVADDPGHFELRWFTPTVEVDLCGHATLGQRARPLGDRPRRRREAGEVRDAQRHADCDETG